MGPLRQRCPVSGRAGRVAVSEHQRNLSNCTSGLESCDYSQLTVLESKALARGERQRNYRACLTGYGYCDRSLLTPAEVRSIPLEHSSALFADTQ